MTRSINKKMYTIEGRGTIAIQRRIEQTPMATSQDLP
jgi:hypothetical protein